VRAAWVLACVAAFLVDGSANAVDAANVLTKAPPAAPSEYDWSGLYVGGHLGYAWGSSNWTTAPGLAGTLDMFQGFDVFKGTGSFFAGLQSGYNYVLPSRFVIGAEADASFPSIENPEGISIGGTSTFYSPMGPESYSETVLSSGTVRGRIGYAPGNWLIYATGGFAWTYDQLTLTQLVTGTTDMPFLWRLGWAAGAGVEVPVAPHWTASIQYLHTDYGQSNTLFANAGQRFDSHLSLQKLSAGLNYHFGDNAAQPNVSPRTPDPDIVNFHGQTTFTWQGYPAFRSPYEGPNSLPSSGEGRETWDATLYAGVRLWQGAELWLNPEIDQGFGIGNTLGVAGYTSGEAYKIGFADPYTRLQRAFIRQTIDLGGETQKVDAGVNQFAGSQTANRLVISVGKFSIADIFDNNKYAHDPRNDFLNWAIIDTGTFDYAAEPWGYTLGAAAEWYQGDWTLRGGLFDLSVLPNNLELDPAFQQFQWVGEIERRYELWGRPGKIAVTGFLSRGRMGSYQDAIALAQITSGPADIAAVRQYQSRGGEHESRTGDHARFRGLRAGRLGERRYRALRIHGHRSHRCGGPIAQWQAMGPAG
jgi:high affinity Mn2+ porin